MSFSRSKTLVHTRENTTWKRHSDCGPTYERCFCTNSTTTGLEIIRSESMQAWGATVQQRSNTSAAVNRENIEDGFWEQGLCVVCSTTADYHRFRSRFSGDGIGLTRFRLPHTTLSATSPLSVPSCTPWHSCPLRLRLTNSGFSTKSWTTEAYRHHIVWGYTR